ncbi:hypothetical protein PCANC_14591 [Puccinia coronata f. sp. avenae]|uniref:Uncharacterized protein n=1 Tax=Puccinia coronata f. sp. avenae TaxID=200324 RepID=A0A2N5UG75_9BASI|nr:hypothetical protein PCANC_14591 [Puccinia coronata f. sp. avenae]
MAQDNDLPGNNVEAKENEGLDQGTDGRSWMEYEIERIRHDLSLDDPAEELDEMVENNQDWFPFKSQIELVGLLLVGYTQNVVSRTLYNQIRLILNDLCQLKIPAWATVRRSQQRIRKYLEMDVTMKDSVLGMPCASLPSTCTLRNELANPLVAPFLDFYPEETNGRNQFKLSQYKKWLEMPPDV